MREIGGCTVDELAERLDWAEFSEWRAIFMREDREVKKQKEEADRERAAAKRGGTSGRLPSSKARRQAVVVPPVAPPFRPPSRGAER